MTTAEKAKEAVLTRIILLAKDATILDLFPLTDAIGKLTGESTKYANIMAESLSKILEQPLIQKSGKDDTRRKKSNA